MHFFDDFAVALNIGIWNHSAEQVGLVHENVLDLFEYVLNEPPSQNCRGLWIQGQQSNENVPKRELPLTNVLSFNALQSSRVSTADSLIIQWTFLVLGVCEGAGQNDGWVRLTEGHSRLGLTFLCCIAITFPHSSTRGGKSKCNCFFSSSGWERMGPGAEPRGQQEGSGMIHHFLAGPDSCWRGFF